MLGSGGGSGGWGKYEDKAIPGFQLFFIFIYKVKVIIIVQRVKCLKGDSTQR